LSLLDRFEHAIERLMEGTSGSLFRQPVQPAEIGKRLEREMLANRKASVGTSIVPNTYTVRLHPRDFEQFAGYATGLSRQMEAWLAKVATERNLSVIDRIQVRMEEDQTVRRRAVGIDSAIVDGRSGMARAAHRVAPAQPTAAFAIAAPAAPSRLMLVGLDGAFRGREMEVREGQVSIGRGSECDLVFDAPDISRRHARIEWRAGHARVEDLGSTNGTFVNGEPIRIADIEAGDEIRFGDHGFEIRFGRAADRPRFSR
jgi:hypothetical protein